MRVVLIDSDPIFRLGLRIALERVPSIQIVAETEAGNTALTLLAELTKNDITAVNLVVLAVNFDVSQPGQQSDLHLCRQLKAQSPHLPILILSGQPTPNLLATARATGADGYCPKGIDVSELVTAIQQVGTGGSYGFGELWTRGAREQRSIVSSTLSRKRRLSGIDYVEASLAEITEQLQAPGLPLLQQAVLAGRRRELLAARWLLRSLISPPPPQVDTPTSQPLQLLSSANQTLTASEFHSDTPLSNLQTTLFTATVSKLQFSLQNLTDEPLEIDILQEAKKRELLYLILRKLRKLLDELRFSEIELSQLAYKRQVFLQDLWKESISEFFGKYSTVRNENGNLEIASTLLSEIAVVEPAILDKIPLVTDLLAYLSFDRPLIIDNVTPDTAQMWERAEIILQNLLIQMANAVVQPLLNNFANVEAIKHNFYDVKLLSTRQVESFRNSLSWKYRWQNYLREPTAIFESRYEFLILAPRGIAKVSIYSPRTQELSQLSGIPLLVTLAIELRDAVAPRLRTAIAFVGSGVVYILTQVIGRTIGLIGRGILQGLGSATFPEKKLKK